MFDPYYKWLGISPKDQPPNLYRLLGLDLFESDPDVIDAAANRQMTYLQQRATGEHAALSQQLLNEVAAARLSLLDPKKKSEYDHGLREALGKTEPEANTLLAGLLDELESPVPEQSSEPMRPSAASRRLWSVEPWHIAVVIGVAFLFGLGCYAILWHPRTPSTAENSPNAEHRIEATDRTGKSDTHDNQSIARDTVRLETVGTAGSEVQPTDVTIADGPDESSTNGAEAKTSEEVSVKYTLIISPPQAVLTILQGCFGSAQR